MQKVVVVSGLKFAIKPPDEDRPYGYRRAEPIAAIVYIAWSSSPCGDIAR
jgi:divalent metal cation (Fe/Co/Zn/Cd) transporter